MNIQKLYKVYKTVNEMLGDRGYKTAGKLLKMEELLDKYNENNLFNKFSHKKDEKNTAIYIFFQPFYENNKQIGVDKIKTLLNKYEEEIRYNTTKILITSNNFTHYAMRDLKKKYPTMEVFHNDQLYFNITKHVLNPKFVVLSEKEKENLLSTYKSVCLPQIKIDDPMCKYFNAKPGNIFQITRKNNDVYFRLVIN